MKCVFSFIFSELDLNAKDTFIQEFVQKPFLIDGRKFDIGLYVIITSIDPLRIYMVGDEMLVRFCPKDYQPIDYKDVDKYVVGDDYTPMWEVGTEPNQKGHFVTHNLSPAPFSSPHVSPKSLRFLDQ